MNEWPVIETMEVHSVEKRTLRVRDYLQILAVTVLVAFFLKTFVVEAYRIPSSSMENTLLAGDFLLVNKFIYGAQTPNTVPLTTYEIPRVRLPAITTPQRGDLVVFRLPEYARVLSLTETTNFVKRCIGLPGDTVLIVNRRVYVNGEELSTAKVGKATKRRMFPKGFGDSRIFPKGSAFNEDNYGPLPIPKRGDRLSLSADTYLYVKDIMQHEGHAIRLDSNNTVLIDGMGQDYYTVERDYFFMMGDNRDNSLDSRFWGFVPDDLITGKVMMVYWSVEESDESFPANIRWDRIGTIVR